MLELRQGVEPARKQDLLDRFEQPQLAGKLVQFPRQVRGPYGRAAHDLTVVGMGSSQLEDVLKGVADSMGLSLHSESHPEAGGYFRSDHFNFAKAGVPAMDIGSGDDLIQGGMVDSREAAEVLQQSFALKDGQIETRLGGRKAESRR